MNVKKKVALSAYEDNPEKMGDVLTKMASQGAVISEDDIKLYIESWARKSDTVRAQANFCSTALSIFKRGYGSYIVHNGGVSALIGILKQCSSDVELSISAAHVLVAMLHDGFEGVLLGPLKDSGGVAALVGLLSARIDSADLQRAAVDALQRLVPDTGVQRIVCDAGGIESLMHVAILHQRDRAIQLGALRILAALASTDEQRARIVENLGIDSVTTVMGHYADDPEVLGACCRALGYIVVSLDLAMALPDTLADALAALEVCGPPLSQNSRKNKQKNNGKRYCYQSDRCV